MSYDAVSLRALGCSIGIERGDCPTVHGYEPGNGTRYDLSFARRAGGGWIMVWDSAWIVAKVSASRTMHRDINPRSCSFEVVASPKGSKLSQPDRDALIALCAAMFAEGVLS